MKRHARPVLGLGATTGMCGAALCTILLALLPAVPVVAQEKKGEAEATPGEDTWYAASLSRGDAGFLVTHYWSKGARFRAETVIAGHRIVTIVNGEYYYTIDKLLGNGIAIRRSPASVKQDPTRGRPFGSERQEIVDGGGEWVARETLFGRKSDIYRVTNANGRRQVWVAADESKLPLRVETYHRASGRTDTVDYVNWLAGLAISDGFFEPDAGVDLRRVEYEEYVERSGRKLMGPAPVLYRELLHGRRDTD